MQQIVNGVNVHYVRNTATGAVRRFQVRDAPMRAVCVFNDPKMMADHQRGRAAEFESGYPLTVGKTYVVLGMSIWETSSIFSFVTTGLARGSLRQDSSICLLLQSQPAGCSVSERVSVLRGGTCGHRLG